MNKEYKDRQKSTIWGALVADAAAMGLHWVYDQQRIRDVAPETPEFRAPDKSDYEGILGFYAHGHKKPGDLSHYGEQLMVMLRSLVANDGQYSKANYEDSFRQHFGYGGEYVGYIDHPTRDTLDNIARGEYEALKRAESIPFDGDGNTQRMMITKVLANAKESVTNLRDNVEKAVRTTHDDDDLVAYAFEILEELKSVSGYHGADDVQLPAVSKLPALVAVHSGSSSSEILLSEIVESAVRVTNNNDLAVQCGLGAASILNSVINGVDLNTALASGQEHSPHEMSGYIAQALSLVEQDNLSATAKFGLSCNLAFGIPSAVHNMTVSESYVEAIRNNIYAGGDSCGRAVFLGAVLGAVNGIGGEKGIPQEWIEKINQKQEIATLVDQLFD